MGSLIGKGYLGVEFVGRVYTKSLRITGAEGQVDLMRACSRTI